MSLDDRDWYREEMRRRNAANARPGSRGYVHPELKHLQSRRSVPRAVMALFWLAVLGALYLVFKYAERNGPSNFAWSQIGDLMYANHTRLIGLFGIVLAIAFFRAISERRRRRQNAGWKKAVYNPKEFRRQK
jgi:hypothetical protein